VAVAERTETRARSATRTSGITVVAGLLLIGAILLNLGQFRAGDRHTDNNFDAAYRNDTSDITELVITECEWCRDRYAVHLALRVVAPGSTVIVPASSPYAATPYDQGVLAQRLYSLGLTGSVEWAGYRQPASLLAGLDPAPFVLARGPGGERGAPWAIAVADPPATDPDHFLDDALRAGDHEDPGGRPREFVLLQWPAAEGDPRDLLLETSLLPGSVREELAR
jgi:hypothetical protein